MKRSLVAVLWWALVALTASGADAPPDGPGRPRLIDLGAGRCLPCRLMMPVLAGLKKDFAGQLDVVFINVEQDRDAVARYHLKVIPTQIFLDAEGKERFRHEGFLSRAAILTKWRELGVKLEPPSAASGPEP